MNGSTHHNVHHNAHHMEAMMTCLLPLEGLQSSHQLETDLIIHNRDYNQTETQTVQRSQNTGSIHELVSCILGSKVPFEQAQAATSHLVNNNLLGVNDCLRNGLEFEGRIFEGRIIESLTQPIPLTVGMSSLNFKYRYPRLRANHIRRTAESIYEKNVVRTDVWYGHDKSSYRHFIFPIGL